MQILGLGSINHTDSKSANASKMKVPKEAAKKSSFQISDTYKPSETAERTDLIQQVKKKIGTGYYNSESVIDDISYGFADILNQM